MPAAPLEARPAPSRPRVSVVIPCRNEAAFVDETLTSIRGGTFADVEVLVVDGRSGDDSRARIAAHATADPRVMLLDNPSGTTPAALNIGVRAARGDIIVRVDCHSVYPPSYVAALVDALESSGADMVGGRVENVPAHGGAVARAIAVALSSPFGTGSPFRYRAGGGDVDSVQLGCWRRALFDDVGLFDERLMRNQDNEHSARILQRGGRVHMTAAVAVQYHPRSTLRALARQARLNGTWNAFTEWLHPYTFRWRHLLPGVMFLGVALATALVALALVAGRGEYALAAALVLGPYAVANVVASVVAAARARSLALAPLVAVALWVWHFVYGFGVVRGWLLVATGGWRRHLGGGRAS
jgi:glycosyltransferase involved in cell wall biosynthesis